MVVAYITSNRERKRETSGLNYGYISWNEFVQDMLSKGEVSLTYIYC